MRKDLYAPVRQAMVAGRYSEAITLCRALEDRYPNDKNVIFNNPGTFIDAGEGLNDVALVEEGIKRLESVVQDREPRTANEVLSLYNLANGYAARQKLRWSAIWATGGSAFSMDEDTRRQKVCYQRASQEAHLLPVERQADLHVNFGNLLDHASRAVEALDEYEAALSVYPRHPAALAESVTTLMRMSFLVDTDLGPHLVELHRRAKAAHRTRRAHARIAGPDAVRIAQQKLTEIETYADRYGGIDHIRKNVQLREQHVRRDHPHPHRLLRTWAQRRLYLSVNARLPRNPGYWKDELYVRRLSVPVHLSEPYVRQLLDRLNEIKSAYATARYLFTLADSQSTELEQVNEALRFGRVVDGGDWGMKIGLFKVSYRTAADILDKVAGFLNSLLHLGVEDTRVYMTTMWYEGRDKKKGLSSGVSAALGRNPWVRALFDLSLDWQDATQMDHLRQLRHALTHRYVPVYADASAIGTGNEAPTPTPRDIQHMTEQMLRTARAAIIYAIATAEREAHHEESPDRRSAPGGVIRVGPPRT